MNKESLNELHKQLVNKLIASESELNLYKENNHAYINYFTKCVGNELESRYFNIEAYRINQLAFYSGKVEAYKEIIKRVELELAINK